MVHVPRLKKRSGQNSTYEYHSVKKAKMTRGNVYALETTNHRNDLIIPTTGVADRKSDTHVKMIRGTPTAREGELRCLRLPNRVFA